MESCCLLFNDVIKNIKYYWLFIHSSLLLLLLLKLPLIWGNALVLRSVTRVVRVQSYRSLRLVGWRTPILLLLIKSRDGLRRHSGSRDIIGRRVGSSTVTSWLGGPLIVHNLSIWRDNLLAVLLLRTCRCTALGRSSLSVSLTLGENHLVVLRIHFAVWRQRPIRFLIATESTAASKIVHQCLLRGSSWPHITTFLYCRRWFDTISSNISLWASTSASLLILGPWLNWLGSVRIPSQIIIDDRSCSHCLLSRVHIQLPFGFLIGGSLKILPVFIISYGSLCVWYVHWVIKFVIVAIVWWILTCHSLRLSLLLGSARSYLPSRRRIPWDVKLVLRVILCVDLFVIILLIFICC